TSLDYILFENSLNLKMNLTTIGQSRRCTRSKTKNRNYRNRVLSFKQCENIHRALSKRRRKPNNNQPQANNNQLQANNNQPQANNNQLQANNNQLQANNNQLQNNQVRLQRN